MKQWSGWIAVMTLAAQTVVGDTTNAPVAAGQRLPEVTVYGTVEGQEVTGPFLPAVDGARIAEGKKTTVADVAAQPVVVDNNHRQTFAQLPGLLISEMAIPSQLNLNYRGVGDPHESEFLLTMQDGIPIVSDWFGYPTSYYTPPSELVERVELLRGGASLLYGPQPGPVLNFVTARPPADRRFTASTQHTLGSDGLYSTFNQFGGTTGAFGYRGSFHHRQADGARDNADYRVFSGDLHLAFQADAQTRIVLRFTGYESESGEAGRLTLAQYVANRDQTTKPFDRIWISRYVPSLTVEHDLNPDTRVEVKAWGGYQDRFSRRQANTLTNNLDRQEFYFGGLDARMRHFWTALGEQHALTAGFVLYGADSPRTRERGSPLTAESGAPAFDMNRRTLYASVFAENKFQFGRLAVVPALRLEMMDLQAEENLNTGKTLQSESFSDVVPLAGLGLAYDLGRFGEVYANASQGYRPPKYDDLVNPTRSVAGQGRSPEPGETWNFELGWRGQPASWFEYDTSLFFIDWDGVVETLVSGPDEIRSNSGRAQFRGWETSAAVDLIGLSDQFTRAGRAARWGSLRVFGSLALLDAEFVDGTKDGREPSYAPGYVIKTGAIYRWRDRLKLALLGQFVDEHFWQDSNTAGSVGTATIAPYSIWDLTAEATVFRDNVSIFAGINNLFDEDYYSRIRSDGIEPATGRTFYGGVKVKF